MVRGPARKSATLRLIEGTDRRGRTGRTLDRSREPIPLEGPMVPPYDMAAVPRQVWDATVAQLEAMGLAHPADANQLAAYCEAVSLHRAASRELAGQRLLVAGSRSSVANKLINVCDRAATQMLRLAQEFGLTPAARARVEVQLRPGPAGDDNPFAG